MAGRKRKRSSPLLPSDASDEKRVECDHRQAFSSSTEGYTTAALVHQSSSAPSPIKDASLPAGLSRSDDNGGPRAATSFLDLPVEIREMIYAYAFVPPLSDGLVSGCRAIEVNRRGTLAVQPAISRVCRRMRRESLDIFYSQTQFFVDLRTWAQINPASFGIMGPVEAFVSWIKAIGNQGTNKLNNLSFLARRYGIRVRVQKLENRSWSLSVMLQRFSLPGPKLAQSVPHDYTFNTVIRRAKQGLERLTANPQAQVAENGLDVDACTKLASAISKVQVFLCCGGPHGLGFSDAMLLEENAPIPSWPSTRDHLRSCTECAVFGIVGYDVEGRSGD